MSNAALNWAWGQTGISARAKFVLVALADKAREGHAAFVKQAELSEKTMTSERQVRAVLQELEEAGLVTRQRRGGDGKGRLSDAFVLAVDTPRRDEQPEQIAGYSSIADAEQPAEIAGSGNRKTAPVASSQPERIAGCEAGATGNLAGGNRQSTASNRQSTAAHIDEPIEPNGPKLSGEERAGASTAAAERANVRPLPTTSAAAMLAWFERLTQPDVAGPGLADPAKHEGLTLSMGELARWAAAGFDLEVDVVPIVRGKTATPAADGQPIRSWTYFTAAVHAAHKRRIAPIPTEASDGRHQPHDARFGAGASGARDQRSRRQRDDDAQGVAMLEALRRARAAESAADAERARAAGAGRGGSVHALPGGLGHTAGARGGDADAAPADGALPFDDAGPGARSVALG